MPICPKCGKFVTMLTPADTYWCKPCGILLNSVSIVFMESLKEEILKLKDDKAGYLDLQILAPVFDKKGG